MEEQNDISETLRFGCVSFSNWADYAWKNELHQQRDRVLSLFEEVIQDEQTAHNPHHMLERAFGVASFCMRRLIECRLVTDTFRETALPIFMIPTSVGPRNHNPFLNSAGGYFFENYDMKRRTQGRVLPKDIADRFLHARFIAILSGSCYLPNGLLIASDRQSKRSLFHMTMEEFDGIVQAFLDDRVKTELNCIDTETGEVCAKRL